MAYPSVLLIFETLVLKFLCILFGVLAHFREIPGRFPTFRSRARTTFYLPKTNLKIVKFTDVCMTGSIMHTPSHTDVCKFSTYIFSADIPPEFLKLGRVTKVKVLFLVLVFVFDFSLF